MYRMGCSQRLPRIMCAWKRMRNFLLFQKEYAGLRVKGLVCLKPMIIIMQIIKDSTKYLNTIFEI